MRKFTNPHSMLPPPPPPRLNRKYISKQNFFYSIGGILPGVLLSGGLFFGIPWLFPYKVKPLDYTSPSYVLNNATERKRLKKTQQVLAQRQTLVPSYLPNKPFGGMNMYGSRVTPKPVFTLPKAINLVDDLIPSLQIETETHELQSN